MCGFAKKILTLAAAAAICLVCGAQAQLQTKKYRLAQFRQRNLEVVLNGNEMNDALLRDCIKKSWYISPFEFCDRQTFDREKRDSTKFFLLISESTSNNEEGAGIYTIGVFQGSGKKNLYKVTSIPFCPTADADGREFTFLPLLLSTLQLDLDSIMKNELNPGGRVKVRWSKKDWNKRICFSEIDVSPVPGESERAAYRQFGIMFLSENDVEELVRKGSPDAVVSYSVAPAAGTKGGTCSKMLIDAATGELYYFGRHTISARKGAGFLKSDLDSIFSHKR